MRRGRGCKEIKEKRLGEDRRDLDARRRKEKARTEKYYPILLKRLPVQDAQMQRLLNPVPYIRDA